MRELNTVNVEQIHSKIIKMVKYTVKNRLLEFHSHVYLLYLIK